MQRVALRPKPAPVAEPERKIQFCVDSGAFSAWRLKKPINLDKYCRFLERNMDWITLYVSLDVIIPNDLERAAEESFNNLVTMQKRGFNPIHVLHAGESLDWLKRTLDTGCTHIGLAATSNASRSAGEEWYEFMWGNLVTADGEPIVKVHGFGETSPHRLKMYPWATADSSSWLSGLRYGDIYLPGGHKVGHGHAMKSSKSSLDISVLDGFDAEHLDRFLKRAGIDKQILANRNGALAWITRSYLTSFFFLELEKEVRALQPIRFKANQGLILKNTEYESHQAISTPFDLYLALGGNRAILPTMYAAHCDKILVSYFYVDVYGEDALREYIKTPRITLQRPHYAKHFKILKEILDDERI